MNKKLRMTSKLSKVYLNLKSIRENSFVRVVSITMTALLMTASISGCSPMQVSERTLLMQIDEPKESELPIISDVYPPSVKSDVYNPEKDEEQFILP